MLHTTLTHPQPSKHNNLFILQISNNTYVFYLCIFSFVYVKPTKILFFCIYVLDLYIYSQDWFMILPQPAAQHQSCPTQTAPSRAFGLSTTLCLPQTQSYSMFRSCKATLILSTQCFSSLRQQIGDLPLPSSVLSCFNEHLAILSSLEANPLDASPYNEAYVRGDFILAFQFEKGQAIPAECTDSTMHVYGNLGPRPKKHTLLQSSIELLRCMQNMHAKIWSHFFYQTEFRPYYSHHM